MKNQKIAFAAAGLVAAGIVSAVLSRRRSGPRLAAARSRLAGWQAATGDDLVFAELGL